MIRTVLIRGVCAAVFMASLLTMVPRAAGQVPAPPATPTAQEATSERADLLQEVSVRRFRRPALRVGQDYTLRATETVGDVTVVFGDARVEGRIQGDLVVIFGHADLGAAAVVEGSFVVVGGEATVAPGALVRRDVVTVGSDLDAPGDFIFAGEHIVIGTAVLGDWMRSVTPWLATGLLWGRPIVPSLAWVWSIVGVFFVVYLLVNLLLHEPVRASADVLARRPFGAFMVGLLVLLLWAPVAALLTVSVVGIIVIPFFLCALVVAGVVGRVSVMRWIGNSLIAPDEPASRLLALRSFVLGFALLTLVYLVPVLGFVTWGLVGVFGLGATVMAFLAAWRREVPKAPPAPPVRAPVPPPAPAWSTTPIVAPVSAASAVPPLAADATTPLAPAPPSAPPAVSSLPRAGFLDRAIAFGLDVMLIAVLHEGLRGTVFPRYSEFFFPLLLIYFIAFWTWKGTTVGGIVMKLRVIKTTGAPIEAADAIVRALAGVLSFIALGIGVLWILRSDDLAPDGQPARQGWHDKAVGTWVVRDTSGS